MIQNVKVSEGGGGGGAVIFFFQAEDGIRDRLVTGVQSVLFRSLHFKSPSGFRLSWSREWWDTGFSDVKHE